MSVSGVFLSFLVLASLGGILDLWLKRRKRRQMTHAACGKCGYDVTVTLGFAPRCPECGHAFAAVGVVPPGGWREERSKVSTTITIVCLVVVSGMTVASFVQLTASRKAAQSAMQQALARQQAAAQAAAAQTAAMPNQTTAPSTAAPSATFPAASAPATAAFEFPPPITAEQVLAMTKEEARAALFQRAVAEKQEADDETRDRIVRERKMLIEFLKGNSPTSQPVNTPAATSPAAPPDALPPLTAQQINAMSKADARTALYERAIAERRNRAYPDVVERLKQERRLLIERLKQRDP